MTFIGLFFFVLFCVHARNIFLPLINVSIDLYFVVCEGSFFSLLFFFLTDNIISNVSVFGTIAVVSAVIVVIIIIAKRRQQQAAMSTTSYTYAKM